MVELRLNGQFIAARQGETILEAARRRGAHMWFLCDGRGICQTCQCRVVSGGENLSEQTAMERAGLPRDARWKGYRLGCQARLTGAGPVWAVSRAEDLRRRLWDVFPGSGTRSFGTRVRDFAGDSLEASVDLAAGISAAAPYTVQQLIRYPPTTGRVLAVATDTLRLLSKLWSEPNPRIEP